LLLVFSFACLLACLQDYSDDDWEQREEERKQQAAAGAAQPSYSKGTVHSVCVNSICVCDRVVYV
jgi:hypothetical protein